MSTTNEPPSVAAPLAEPLVADDLPAPPITLAFCLAIGIAALPMLIFGINTGVLNAPESVIFPGHSVFSWSLAVSSFCVGGFLGSANAGRLADHYGRRTSLLVIFAINFFFGTLHVLTPNMTLLIGARVGVGLAGGASTVLTPMYLSEVAPQSIKGSIGTVTQLSCVLGILASILFALPFCTGQTWRFIFVPLPVLSLAGLLAGYVWLPESPRWLLLHHYNTRADEARATIRNFQNIQQGEDNDETVEMQVLLMTNNMNGSPPSSSSQQSAAAAAEASQEDQQLQLAADYRGAEDEPQYNSFQEYALDPNNRIPLVSSILFPVAQQLSGINALFYYSTLFFDGIIENPENGTIAVFAINVVATLVALLLMDKLGRRTLLAWSAGGMGVCCIFLTFSLLGILPPIMTVILVMLYISFFELGLGCIPFFLSSELIQPQFLGTVQSISMASNWVSNFCVGLLFPYMDKFLGAYAFIPFGIALLGTVWYTLWILPETRGKSLEIVMDELLQAQQEEPQPIPQFETENTDDAELL